MVRNRGIRENMDHIGITPKAPGRDDVTNSFWQCPVCLRVFVSTHGWCSHCGVDGKPWGGKLTKESAGDS